MKNGSKNKVDIAILQTQVLSIIERLERIENNDLLHLKEAIDKTHDHIDQIERKLAYYSGGIAVFMIVLETVIKFVNK